MGQAWGTYLFKEFHCFSVFFSDVQRCSGFSPFWGRCLVWVGFLCLYSISINVHVRLNSFKFKNSVIILVLVLSPYSPSPDLYVYIQLVHAYICNASKTKISQTRPHSSYIWNAKSSTRPHGLLARPLTRRKVAWISIREAHVHRCEGDVDWRRRGSRRRRGWLKESLRIVIFTKLVGIPVGGNGNLPQVRLREVHGDGDREEWFEGVDGSGSGIEIGIVIVAVCLRRH